MRGAGKRCVFEDDNDRIAFLDRCVRYSNRHHTHLIAWVLMGNHFHLLIHAELEDMVNFMRSLGTSYAQYFNGAHTHVGHVFQNRYTSLPVETDEQLLATIRYIHLNPLNAGIAQAHEYPWSSYRQYLGAEGLCNARAVKELRESIGDIRRFHEASVADSIIPTNAYRARMDDAEAMSLVNNVLGTNYIDEILHMQRPERDHALLRLYRLGLSGSQITRLTGLGRGIVQRACCGGRHLADV